MNFFDRDIFSKSVWVPDIPVEIPRRAGGAVDSVGITYHGPILAGLVTPRDALLRSSARGNPLDPFNVEGKTWAPETL
jgi:hypothetical protein